MLTSEQIWNEHNVKLENLFNLFIIKQTHYLVS